MNDVPYYELQLSRMLYVMYTSGNEHVGHVPCMAHRDPKYNTKKVLKVKVKLSLCLTKLHATKTHWEIPALTCIRTL